MNQQEEQALRISKRQGKELIEMLDLIYGCSRSHPLVEVPRMLSERFGLNKGEGELLVAVFSESHRIDERQWDCAFDMMDA